MTSPSVSNSLVAPYEPLADQISKETFSATYVRSNFSCKAVG